MKTRMQLLKDDNSNPNYGLYFSNLGYYINLPASTEEILTVPAGINQAFFQFSPGTNVWVIASEDDLDLPTSSFAPTTADLNPVIRYVEEGQTLRFICDTTSYVKVSFYTDGRAA